MSKPFADQTDTSPEVLAWFSAKWRSMAPADKADLADQLTTDCTTLALAGIAARQPDASPSMIRYELAVRRYGKALATEVYGPQASG